MKIELACDIDAIVDALGYRPSAQFGIVGAVRMAVHDCETWRALVRQVVLASCGEPADSTYKPGLGPEIHRRVDEVCEMLQHEQRQHIETTAERDALVARLAESEAAAAAQPHIRQCPGCGGDHVDWIMRDGHAICIHCAVRHDRRLLRKYDELSDRLEAAEAERDEARAERDAARAERDRLQGLFDEAGGGEYDVLALVDHYQRATFESDAQLAEARAEIDALRALLALRRAEIEELRAGIPERAFTAKTAAELRDVAAARPAARAELAADAGPCCPGKESSDVPNNSSILS